MILLQIFAASVVIGWAATLVHAIKMKRQNEHLSAVPIRQEPLPLVSVIVPACNEAAKIRSSLQTLLDQNYPDLEIIAIDDRSTDDTGKILDSFTDARLRVIHIRTLPKGWLGKNHANQKGFEIASGEYLLFTDADVAFDPDVIWRTVSFAATHNAKHIVAYPKMLTESVWEAAFIALFGLLFTFKFNPRGARDPKNKRDFIGVGAFNFIKRDLYEKIGTHRRLALDVADDIKLGYWVKQCEAATFVLNSDGKVRVRWREGLLDSVQAIVRSGFAGVNYSWTWVFVVLAGTFGGLLSPYWLVFVPDVFSQICGGVAVVLVALMYHVQSKTYLSTPVAWALHPVMSVLFLYGFVRSAVEMTLRGGLAWRGTFYSLAELKAGSKV
jgi:glycosyltransferase involved in cell wall biosynthesis